MSAAALKVVLGRLERSAVLFDDLVAEIPESALVQKLPGLRSNSVGAQLWCVVGARESYGKAIVAGEWQGFSCSLTAAACHSKSQLQKHLSESAAALREVASCDDPSERQLELIVDLLEHEAAHQGQLIRYLYALDLAIPESWKSRYALS